MNISRKKIALFLLVLSLCAVLYSHRNEIFLNKNVSDGDNHIIFNMDSSLQRNFDVYGNSLLINDNQEIFAISKTGKIIWTIPCITKNPMLSLAGEYILVADRGGNDLFVIKDGKLISQTTLDTEIFTAKINKNGYVSVVSSEDGYRSKVLVLTPTGENIYSWKLSDSYSLDCAVSPDNRRLAVALLSFDEEKMIGAVSLVDMREEKILENSEFSNCIFSKITFNSDGDFLAVSDTAALYYNKNGKNIWNKNFDGRTLQSCTFSPKSNIAFIFENTRNTSTLECYSTSGKLLRSTELSYEIKTLFQNSNSFLVAGSRDLTLFDSRGKKIKTISLDSEIRWAGLCETNRKIFAIHGNYIEFF